MPSTTDSRCPYCGSPLLEVLEVLGQRIEIPRPCECADAKAARKAEEKRMAEAEREANRRKVNDKLRRSGIPARYVDARHPMAKQSAQRFVGGQWYWITGEFGTLKTHLACAINRLLVLNKAPIKFVTGVDLLIELQSTYNKANASDEAEILSKYSSCRHLTIDDIGKESVTPWSLTRLYSIINARDANLMPTIFTSNFKISEYVARLAQTDESMAEALGSRLAGACEVIELSGGDRRLS